MIISAMVVLGWIIFVLPTVNVSVSFYVYGVIILFYNEFFRKDFSHYRVKINNWKVSLYIVLFLICWNYFSVIAMTPIVGFDPQHLLQRDKVRLMAILYNTPIVFIQAVGEEYVKMSIFLGCFALLPIPRRYKMLMATAISAVVFGVVHYVAWGWNCVIPIILGSIPTYFIFYYIRSLNLVILAHFFTNMITIVILLEGYGEQLFVAFVILMVMFLAYPFLYRNTKV